MSIDFAKLLQIDLADFADFADVPKLLSIDLWTSLVVSQYVPVRNTLR